MKRLIKKHKNSPKEYDRIFTIRQKESPNWADMRRWRTLIMKFKGGSLLDMGCLDSQVIKMAYKRYPKAELWGIDVAENAVWKMQKKHPFATFDIQDLYDTSFPDNTFEYIVLGEVMEHLEEPQKAINEALRILRPGGWLAISTPLEEVREPGAVDKHRHIWSFSEEDIKQLTRPHEIKIKVLRSQKKPYKYCWPQLIAFTKKG